MPFEPLEERRMYRHAEDFAEKIWDLVSGWDWFARRNVGSQFVRAADSIGANIAEAGGRFHPGDVKNFLYYARGSLRETKYWLRLLAKAAPEIKEAARSNWKEAQELHLIFAAIHRSSRKPSA